MRPRASACKPLYRYSLSGDLSGSYCGRLRNPFRTTQETLVSDSPVNTNKPWFQPWFQSGAGFRLSTVYPLHLKRTLDPPQKQEDLATIDGSFPRRPGCVCSLCAQWLYPLSDAEANKNVPKVAQCGENAMINLITSRSSQEVSTPDYPSSALLPLFRGRVPLLNSTKLVPTS